MNGSEIMIGQETPDIERKVIAILKVLNDSQEPLGGRIIARRLNDFGIELGERAVRYHLKLMDERGLTRTVGVRDGRYITEQGIEELGGALVRDRVGAITARIESLAYRTSLDLDKYTGAVPINTSLFPEDEFKTALEIMREPFKAGLCVSELVAVANEGEMLGEVTVPSGKVGLATVSNVAINGALLKAGVPLDSRFGGVLQFRNNSPLRFIERAHGMLRLLAFTRRDICGKQDDKGKRSGKPRRRQDIGPFPRAPCTVPTYGGYSIE